MVQILGDIQNTDSGVQYSDVQKLLSHDLNTKYIGAFKFKQLLEIKTETAQTSRKPDPKVRHSMP